MEPKVGPVFGSRVFYRTLVAQVKTKLFISFFYFNK